MQNVSFQTAGSHNIQLFLHTHQQETRTSERLSSYSLAARRLKPDNHSSTSNMTYGIQRLDSQRILSLDMKEAITVFLDRLIDIVALTGLFHCKLR